MMKEATFFLVANLAAGVLNYLYQILASKQLSATDFANFSSWFAGLASFFFIGGILQYAGSFFPVEREKLRTQIALINGIIAVVLVTFALFTPHDQMAIGIAAISVSLASGWLTGQAQNRMLFYVIGWFNVAVATSKLIVVLVPQPQAPPIYTYQLAALLAMLPGLWLLSLAQWSSASGIHKPQRPKGILNLWASPLVLSITAACIPQVDLLVVRQITSELDFQTFARASLFYKGVFFLFMIAAQWLLPRQIRSVDSKRSPATSLKLAPLAVVGSLVVAITSEPIALILLGWESAPPFAMVALSCMNMCLLTWIFLMVQEICTKGLGLTALALTVALVAEAAAQFLLKLEVMNYLYLALASQILIVFASRKVLLQSALRPK